MMNNTAEIETLFYNQVKDLTRRTIKGNNLVKKKYQADLDDFRYTKFNRKNVGRIFGRNSVKCVARNVALVCLNKWRLHLFLISAL